MSKKILYFTAGPVATSAEVLAIASLVAQATDPYEVLVQSGKPQATLTGVKLSAIASDNSYNDAGASISAGTISADAADNSINDSGNGFVTAGFQVGDVVTVSGFTGSTANNAARIATAVTAAKITFAGADGDTIVSDSAGETVTATAPGRFLLRGFKVGQHVMVRGFTGTVANNIDDGAITSLTATKMIVGGTAGDVIVNDASGESVTICTVNTDASYGNVEVVADYIAGTIPEQYKTSGTPIYTQFDITNPPNPDNMIATQMALTTGDTIALDTAGTVTVTIAAGAITAADVASTESVVTHGDTLEVDGSDVTLSVVAHALTGALAATKCVVTTGDTVAVDGSDVTLTVAGNALTAGALAATKCVVTTGDTVTVDGAEVTLTVAGNAVTAAALAATKCVVTTGDVIPITGGAGTQVVITVAGNAITACVQS